MQKFVNNPDFVVDDMIEGFVKAHCDIICKSERNKRVVKYKNCPVKNKVGIVTGGGSGHEPAFLGYVGENMADAVAVGEVFSSPPAKAFFDAFIEADSGNGVACLFGNYAGDTMNVKLAVDMAEDEDVEVKYVVATDDVASAPKDQKQKRHGIAGGPLMWKICGAKASMSANLDEIITLGQKVVDNTRSICVGLAPCVIPAVGKPNFKIDEGTMEFGVGHHGETGIKVESLKNAKEIAKEMTDAVINDLECKENDELIIILSGLGSTPIMELYVLFNEIEKVISDYNIRIHKALIGNYVTSLDMNGAALTIMSVDNELKELFDMPSYSPGLIIK